MDVMEFEGVHHISLNVGDVEAAATFYRDVLGLTVIERPDMGFPGVWFEMGAQQLHLLEVKDFQAPKGQHFALAVTNIISSRERLLKQGVKVSEPTEIKGVCLQCFFQDPTGTLLELNQALKSKAG